MELIDRWNALANKTDEIKEFENTVIIATKY